MQRVSIKTYAAKHKLSMFNVVKMVKSGQLKSEVVEENGKETTYILSDEAPVKRIEAVSEKGADESLEEKVARLEQDVAILKRELDALKMSMGISG